jgi:hypothetical protein
MVFPPGQGKMGQHLMQMWREYLEEYAEHEGNAERQIIVGSYHAAAVFGALSEILDRTGKNSQIIEERNKIFSDGSAKAAQFEDCLVNGTFSLYNHMNTLGRQFTTGNLEAEKLIQQIEIQVQRRMPEGPQINRSALALQAAFPLLSLMALALSPGEETMPAIRQVEQRFTRGAARMVASEEKLLNALYRLVEMMQIIVILSDTELRNQVEQIASRFKEEDEIKDLQLKLRNGFCRLFELGHLLTTHLDAVLT